MIDSSSSAKVTIFLFIWVAYWCPCLPTLVIRYLLTKWRGASLRASSSAVVLLLQESGNQIYQYRLLLWLLLVFILFAFPHGLSASMTLSTSSLLVLQYIFIVYHWIPKQRPILAKPHVRKQHLVNHKQTMLLSTPIHLSVSFLHSKVVLFCGACFRMQLVVTPADKAR
jgi:hypothetical protein